MAVEYPMPAFHFIVDGAGPVSFSEISGLNVEVQLMEYRGGAQPEFQTIKQPGLKKFSELTLKKGVFPGDNQFFEWWNTASLNIVERRDLTISLLNEQHAPVMVWNVKNAWPSKVEGPTLKGDGNEIAVETIVLQHEGIAVASV
jgi:phage tail-like protein